MCHEALEKVFDLEPPERTLENLQNLLRTSWSHHRRNNNGSNSSPSQYANLFTTSEEEKAWGESCLALLQNYYQLEDPTQIPRPNPIQREIWVRAKLPCSSPSSETNDNPTVLVRGVVDRLDLVRISRKSREVCLRLVDYKTGKAPDLKYSQSMNEKICEEAFFQLKIYALLLHKQRQSQPWQRGLELRFLRLLYLTSAEGNAQYLDLDLGATREERELLLEGVEQEIVETYHRIQQLVQTQDPLQFVGCDRSFCYCHKCRPRFLPGSVWEPASTTTRTTGSCEEQMDEGVPF